MADFVGAFFRGLIELVFQGLIEGVVKLMGWRKLLIVLGVVIAGIVIFYYVMPNFTA